MYNRWMPPAYSSELYHHGVKGMRWGVRRYQPYPAGSDGGVFKGGKASARSFSRALNKVENDNAKYRYKAARANRKSVDAIGALRRKSYSKKAAKYEEAVKRGEADVKRLLSDAKASGYTVNSKKTTSFKRVGKSVVSLTMLGLPITTAYTAYKGAKYGKESVGFVDRTTFKVKKEPNRR